MRENHLFLWVENSWSPDEGFSFSLSFAIFVGSISIFQKSTKENSPGTEMADLHIEDSTEGEEQERGEREREKIGGRERKSLSLWFEDDLKETIMSISWRCHAHYAGLIAVFAATKTDYFPTCQTASWRGREGGREREQREKMCIIRRPLHPASFMNNK